MTAHYDLIVRGGTVIDGTGNPRRRADVGVRAGKIAALGRLEGATATEEIDAEGQIVAPGIIDPHTHYDPQITWDPYATASCFHGVTTIWPATAGSPWPPCTRWTSGSSPASSPRSRGWPRSRWRASTGTSSRSRSSWPRRRGRLGVNLACYIGHCNLRRWVMGVEGSARAATPDEIVEMAKLLRQAMDAGAAGLSSTSCPDAQRRGQPSRAQPVRRARRARSHWPTSSARVHRGTISYLPESAVGGLDRSDMDLLIELGQISPTSL